MSSPKILKIPVILSLPTNLKKLKMNKQIMKTHYPYYHLADNVFPLTSRFTLKDVF